MAQRYDEFVWIYSDGACKGNPGPGGWGAWLVYKIHETEIFGGDPNTTNNKMEMQAAIQGLAALKKPCKVLLFTDSKYVVDGIKTWMPNWKKNNWKKSDKKPIKNLELWKQLDDLLEYHTEVRVKWVKGHSGDSGNERADKLANLGIRSLAQY